MVNTHVRVRYNPEIARQVLGDRTGLLPCHVVHEQARPARCTVRELQTSTDTELLKKTLLPLGYSVLLEPWTGWDSGKADKGQ